MNLHIKIHGLVQGTGFRAYIKKEANRFGLEGWAKNSPDGSVEVYATGDATNDFLQACRHGPMSTHVKKIEFLEDINENVTGFTIE